MLFFGGTCFAQQQEEFQRDSVWGLEWNLQDSILTVSFMSSCDGYVAVGLSWYYGGVYSRNTERNAGMYLNEDGGYWTCGTSAEDDIDFVSLNIDTLSTELTRYILSMKLKDIFLTIPQDISSYCGYFGIKFFAPNHMHSVYEVHSTDYTKCQQFLYFNLLDALSFTEYYRNDPASYNEVYYSMSGIPLREMPENEPVIVVRKSADNQVVSSRVCMRKR